RPATTAQRAEADGLLVEIRVVGIGQSRGTRRGFRSGDLPGKIQQHWAQMPAVTEQAGGARASGEEKCQEGLIRLQRVTRRAGEDEIIPPVVGGLALPRRDVIHRYRLRANLPLAIGADGSMPVEEPLTRFHIRVAARRKRRVLLRGAPAALAWFSCPSSWLRQFGRV